LAAATLAVAVLGVGTRGLHLDGLADTVDGLACTGDRARALAVMRNGDVGPAGVAALVLTLLVQVGSLGGLVAQDPAGAALALVVAVVVSRAALAPACVRGIPAARPGGLGATVAGSVPAWAVVVVVVGVEVSAFGLLGVAGLAGAALAVGAAGVLLLWCLRRLGGITGDVLGALVEVALAAALVVLAAVVPGSG
jgi:adenosylcobinamide-GDP ribazoletransferase